MKRLLLPILACALVASWCAAGDEASKGDLKKLQGKWKTVSIVLDGKPLKSTGKTVIWVISGKKVSYPDLGEAEEITLDATKKPETMDIRVVRTGEETKEYKAIYALDGDRLKVCIDLGGKDRPAALESKAGSGHRLVTLERVKD